MSDKTAIEWADSSWNPIRGIAPNRHMCQKISPGCDNCYASTQVHRFGGQEYSYDHVGEVRLDEKALLLPLTWKEPRRVFVCSMTDLFGEWVPQDWIDQLFGVMALTPWHTYQVLTKRPSRMRDYLTQLVQGPWAARVTVDGRPGTDVHFRMTGVLCDLFPRCPAATLNRASAWQDERWPDGDGFLREWPLPNVWLGTSIELDRFTWRANVLRQCPAAVRFISAEPLLGPLPSLDLDGISWLIAGGESGARHRACMPAWVTDLRDRSQEAGTAFFFKQWGGRTHAEGGRVLGGRTWDEFPTPAREPVHA